MALLRYLKPVDGLSDPRGSIIMALLCYLKPVDGLSDPRGSIIMALLCYLKPVDGLSDPRGSLAKEVPSREIAEANRMVQSAQQEARG